MKKTVTAAIIEFNFNYFKNAYDKETLWQLIVKILSKVNITRGDSSTHPIWFFCFLFTVFQLQLRTRKTWTC